MGPDLQAVRLASDLRRGIRLVASRQDVLEAVTGCITKDVLETSALEMLPRRGPGRGFTSFPVVGLFAESSSRRSWQPAMTRFKLNGVQIEVELSEATLRILADMR